jgi:hypothetical protein
MDFLVVRCLEVAARKVAIQVIPNTEVIAVAQLLPPGPHVIDERAVGAIQIEDLVALRRGLESGVPAGHRLIVDPHAALAVAPEQQGFAG